MSSLSAAVADAAAARGALGAVLCDFEGEAVLTCVGGTPLSDAVATEAMRHVPEALPAHHSPEEFLLRLCGAEPCALLALFARTATATGAGTVAGYELRFETVGVVVVCLPEDYYLTVVLDLAVPGTLVEARRVAQAVRPRLAAEIA